MEPNATTTENRGEAEQSAVATIETAMAGLDAVRAQPVAEHVQRFEDVHAALTGALSEADHLLSAANTHRS